MQLHETLVSQYIAFHYFNHNRKADTLVKLRVTASTYSDCLSHLTISANYVSGWYFPRSHWEGSGDFLDICSNNLLTISSSWTATWLAAGLFSLAYTFRCCNLALGFGRTPSILLIWHSVYSSCLSGVKTRQGSSRCRSCPYICYSGTCRYCHSRWTDLAASSVVFCMVTFGVIWFNQFLQSVIGVDAVNVWFIHPIMWLLPEGVLIFILIQMWNGYGSILQEVSHTSMFPGGIHTSPAISYIYLMDTHLVHQDYKTHEHLQRSASPEVVSLDNTFS